MIIKPCSCGGQAEIRAVGDYKQYDEAQITKQGAIKTWNRRADNEV